MGELNEGEIMLIHCDNVVVVVVFSARRVASALDLKPVMKCGLNATVQCTY